MLSFFTSIVRIISRKIFSEAFSVSAASNTGILSSCKSLLYARGRPLQMVKRLIRSPYTRPDLPRISSAISGFFFCGMMLLPVEKESSISTKLNSTELHRISSSQNRDRCIIVTAQQLMNSMAKSLSATASIPLGRTLAKPSSFASKSRSVS